MGWWGGRLSAPPQAPAPLGAPSRKDRMKHLKVGIAVGLAAIAAGVGSQSASAFKAHIPVIGGQPIHEQITDEAFEFMRADVVGDMDGEHAQADVANATENRVHFDGCSFKEGS